jgi:hypothetical protein
MSLGLEGLTETAGAILLAALAALLAFISFAAKLAASWISSWWLRRAAVIRFFNDVEIWMHDAQSSFTVEEFERLADFIENAPRDFRFQIPMSGDADTKEIMKYIHWLRPEEIKAVRRYMMLDELYESTSLVLSSDAFARFGRKRKINALGEMFKTGVLTLAAADVALTLLPRRRRYIKATNAKPLTQLTKQTAAEKNEELSANLQAAIKAKIDAL